MKIGTFTAHKEQILMAAIWVAFYLVVFAIATNAQTGNETFTGTVVSYGSGLNTRTRTSYFTLTIKSETPDAGAQRFLDLLQRDGQDALLAGLRNEDRGRFSIGGNIGRTVNVVREKSVDGKRRIYAVFERWMQFGEVRGGYRSVDYPFGYIELNIDPATGKGDGTYIAAAKIRWRENKGSDGSNVEVEDFATFPARLLAVRSSKGRP